MLKLRVTIDKQSGFCFGVVYAISLAEEILDEHHHLYCLGDIVHNDEEVKRLTKKGLKIISHDELQAIHDDRVLIRAHGEPPATYKIAIENNITLIDASCPVVLKLQNRVKHSTDERNHVYIFGKRGHAEVEGLIGQGDRKAIVFENISELDIEKLPKKISLFSQTTKSTEKFYEIAEALTKQGIEVDVNDTVCRQVSNRDLQLQHFAKTFDKIVFVSGTKSSNGKVLYEVCKKSNPFSFFISKTEELNVEWFSDSETVGICGATSTPLWLMEEVKGMLESF